ncbi:MAG: hypothetical protein ACYC3Q_13620 [Gemmatimonadaceae bacterium]
MAARSRARKTTRPAKPDPRPAPGPAQPAEDEVLRALAQASPSELYHLEKRRRAAGGILPADERVAAAKREFEAMLAAEAGTPRGGRPRKKPVAKPKDEFSELEPHGEDDLTDPEA